MRGRYFGFPRRLKLRRHEEKQIVQLLSRLPRREPRIEIGGYPGDPFAVDYAERFECFVPLRVGTEGFYTDYDARTGERLEASFLRVPRVVRAHGVRFVEYDDIGGDDLHDGQGFHIIWDWDQHHDPHSTKPWHIRDALDAKGIVPRRLTPDDGVRWLDTETAEGPAEGETLFAGYRTVVISGRRFDCLRVLGLCHNPDWPEESEVEWGRLDDRYLNRQGRTVLLRRYRTEADYLDDYSWDMKRNPNTPAWAAWSEGRARLTYNGIEFRHYFDILTDASFGLTWERIGW